MKVLLLANSSKDNTRVGLERVEMDSYGSWVFWIDKLYFYLLNLGTGLYLVCQAPPACSSTPYPDVGITRDGQGYHHLPPTPQPEGMRQIKVASSLDTTSMLSTTTLALRRVIHLYQGPSN
jgi:hypothetical protein